MNYDVLIQGGMILGQDLDKEKIRNILKVRKNLPDGKVILSTWEMEEKNKRMLDNVSRYCQFKVIYNKDPGPLHNLEKNVKYTCNINRLISSTRNGLSFCRNDYVLKIRTDSYLIDDRIIKKLKQCLSPTFEFCKRNPEYSVFKERVINCNLFARMATGYMPYLFHPGDILFFGRREDLTSLFSVEMATHDIFEKSSRLSLHSDMRYVPEQYLWVNCLKNYLGKIVYAGNRLYNKELCLESERYLVNNFIFYSANDLGFVWPKHKTHYHNKGIYSVYDHKDWRNLYAKHIDTNANYNSNIKKNIINKLMFLYFIIRTTLLKIPFVKRVAIKIFTNRE